MTKKRIMTFCLILAMMCTILPAAVYADAKTLDVYYHIPSDGVRIILKGSVSSYATVAVKSVEGAVTDPQTQFKYLAEVTTNNGGFDISVQMPYSCDSGKFYVTIDDGDGEIQKEFWYTQEAATSNFDNLLSTQNSALGVDYTEFASDSDILSAYNKFKPSGTLTRKSFLEAYAYARLFGKAKGETDASKIDKLISDTARTVDLDLAAYNSLSFAAKTELVGRFNQGVYSVNTPTEQFLQWMCLAESNNLAASTAVNYKDILLNKYSSVLNLDSDTYTKFNGNNDAVVTVMGKRPFNSIEDLKKEIKAAANPPVIIPDGGYDDGGSGSGGGGGGGSKSFANEIVSPQSTAFSDVSSSHWAYEAISDMQKAKIISGRDEKTFAPEDNVTRAEFSKIIAEAFFRDAETSEMAFGDVSAGNWYFAYVAKLSKLQIITGDDKGNFNPNAPITRQDAAVIIKRTYDKLQKNALSMREYAAFQDDNVISDYAKDAVKSLYCGGIINGMSETSFMPQNNLTRAQAAMLVYTIMQK